MNVENKNIAKALLLATTVIIFSGCNSAVVTANPTPTPTPTNSQNESSVQKFLKIKILSSKIY